MYSQDNEEAMILEHFDGKMGRLLDIGASDGERFSNSRALMLSGWFGVLVEPCARSFAKLVELYYDNPTAILVNAAISPFDALSSGLSRLNYALDTVVSTFDGLTYEAWKASGRYRDVLIPTITVADLFAQVAPSFQFVTVDAEGWSFLIARRLLEHLSPSLWVIESDPDFHEFDAIMKSKGYQYVKSTQSNSIWKKAA